MKENKPISMKIYAEVFGCSANVADYEIASGLLKQSGFKFVDKEEDSNLNVVFTCTVKSPSVDKMIYRITELSKDGKPLIVAGCMPVTERQVIERINPNACLLGPESIEKINYVAISALQNRKSAILDDTKKPKVCLPRIRRNPVIDIIPISSGCSSNCAYCSVKLARGNLFSYPMELIVKEAKMAIEDGCKELYITSQDNSCYGKDTGKRLPELLDHVCNIQGKFFVRVGMMNPLYVKEIVDDLIKSYKKPEVFKFLHLPLQSGSDDILQAMGRGYSVEEVVEIILKFREEIPEITVSTDVIVGFPGETNKDFLSTVNIIKQMRPDIVNISKFGPRPNTEAAKMKQIDRKIVNERSAYLHKLTKEISLEKNKRWIGWKGEVLVDEKIGNGYTGRNFTYKPAIIKSNEKLLGKFINVKITDATSNCLVCDKF